MKSINEIIKEGKSGKSQSLKDIKDWMKKYPGKIEEVIVKVIGDSLDDDSIQKVACELWEYER